MSLLDIVLSESAILSPTKVYGRECVEAEAVRDALSETGVSIGDGDGDRDKDKAEYKGMMALDNGIIGSKAHWA